MTKRLSALSLRARPIAALSLCAALFAACVVEQPGGLGTSSTTGDTTSSGDPGPVGSGGNGAGNGGGDPGTGGSGGDPVQPASFTIEAAAETPMELKDIIDVTVTVTPNGYVGPVNLTFGTLPDDMNGVLTPSTVDLDGTTPATTTLTVQTRSDTQTGTIPLTVTGTVEGGTKTANLAVVVQPILTINIPQGLNGLQGSQAQPNQTAFGDFPTVIKALPDMSAANPIRIRFFNGDNQVHSIHAGQDGQGFPHGNDIQPGNMENPERAVNAPGTYNYYPHDIGTTIVGRIVIQ